MRRAIALATVGLCLAASAACTNSDATEPRSTSSTSSTPGQSSPTDSLPTSSPPPSEKPTPQPPVLPEAAKAKTTAGAKAFVRFYVDALNFGYLEQDPQAISTVSSGTCQICATIVRNIRHIHAQGGSQKGGSWMVKAMHVVPTGASDRLILIAKVVISPGKARASAEARFQPIAKDRTFYEFHCEWSSRAWLMEDLRSG